MVWIPRIYWTRRKNNRSTKTTSKYFSDGNWTAMKLWKTVSYSALKSHFRLIDTLFLHTCIFAWKGSGYAFFCLFPNFRKFESSGVTHENISDHKDFINMHLCFSRILWSHRFGFSLGSESHASWFRSGNVASCKTRWDQTQMNPLVNLKDRNTFSYKLRLDSALVSSIL